MDWTNWFFLILGLVLAYLLDFTKPWVKAYYEKSVFSSRKKRIQSLIVYYKKINSYANNHEELNQAVILALFRGLSELVTLIIVIGVDILLVLNDMTYEPTNLVLVAIFVTMLWGVGAYSAFKSFYYVMEDVRDFPEYRGKAIKKLIKLGGNPEDLDKEEQ